MPPESANLVKIRSNFVVVDLSEEEFTGGTTDL